MANKMSARGVLKAAESPAAAPAVIKVFLLSLLVLNTLETICPRLPPHMDSGAFPSHHHATANG
ncbi:hypothetical protein BMETH_197_3 [methanotrophic bacterial endosymbiont of Bathymodiolus sp.]|nr:hypothetical protein BMETH_197_3 [methanotrophic bacterial endosymbiont of Bathymodiolus sp.]